MLWLITSRFLAIVRGVVDQGVDIFSGSGIYLLTQKIKKFLLLVQYAQNTLRELTLSFNFTTLVGI